MTDQTRQTANIKGSNYFVMRRFFLLLLLIPALKCISQKNETKTVYQKKVEMLTNQYLLDIGIAPNTIKSYNNLSEEQKKNWLFSHPDFYQKLVSDKSVLLAVQLKLKVDEAAKLKTQVDFAREKAEKINEETRIEKNNEAINEKYEERAKMFRYVNSDFVRLKSTLKTAFDDWKKKGEFEKTNVYEIRMNTNLTSIFDSICFTNINKKIDSVINVENLSRLSERELHDIQLNVLGYNADVEKFGIAITYNNFQWKDSIAVANQRAKDFKDNLRNDKFLFRKGFLYNWCFFDNYLCPQTFYLRRWYSNITESDSIIENTPFYLPSRKIAPLRFTAKDFGLNQPELANKVFDYNEHAMFVYNQSKLNGSPRSDNYTGNGSTEKADVTVVRGNRSVVRATRLQGDFNQSATLYIDVQVDTNGTGTFLRVTKGMNLSEYTSIIRQRLASRDIMFNSNGEESVVNIRVDFKAEN